MLSGSPYRCGGYVAYTHYPRLTLVWYLAQSRLNFISAVITLLSFSAPLLLCELVSLLLVCDIILQSDAQLLPKLLWLVFALWL